MPNVVACNDCNDATTLPNRLWLPHLSRCTARCNDPIGEQPPSGVATTSGITVSVDRKNTAQVTSDTGRDVRAERHADVPRPSRRREVNSPNGPSALPSDGPQRDARGRNGQRCLRVTAWLRSARGPCPWRRNSPWPSGRNRSAARLRRPRTTSRPVGSRFSWAYGVPRSSL